MAPIIKVSARAQVVVEFLTYQTLGHQLPQEDVSGVIMQDNTEFKYCLGQCRKGHSSYLSMGSEEATGEKTSIWNDTKKKATLGSVSSVESSQELRMPVSQPSKNTANEGRQKAPILFLSSNTEDSLLMASENKWKYSSGSEPELEGSFAALQAKLDSGGKSKLPACLQCFCLKRSGSEEQVKIISSEDLYAMLDETSPPKNTGKNSKGTYLTDKN